MNIKPGMLCYLVSNGEHVYNSEVLGRVVTIVRRYDNNSWVVEAEWVPKFCKSTGREPFVHDRHLRPIHDPDADISETHDEELTA